MLELSTKQKLFADYIISGKSQIDSIKLSGWKAKNDSVLSVTANRLLKNIKIQQYIDAKRQQFEQETRKKYDLTQENVVKGYNTIIDTLQVIIDNPESDERSRISALKVQKDTKDSLSRIAGLFNDKLHVVKDVEDVTKEDSQTLARIAKGEVMTSQAVN